MDLGSYSSRVTLMTGNAALQAAERAREMLVAAAAGKLEVPAVRIALAEGRVFDVEDPRRGMPFPEAVVAAESRLGTIGTVGSYSPPPSAERLLREPGRPLARLLLLGRGRGSRGGPGNRHRDGPEGVDRARRRQVHQPRAHHWTGRGFRLHGPGRDPHGRDGLPLRRPRQPRAQVSVAARIQEPDDQGDVRGGQRFSSRTPDPNGPFGAKEVEQGPLLPIPPAVANGIFDAVGVHVDECPRHPRRF